MNDWSEIAILLKQLSAKRDELLNMKKYMAALDVQNELTYCNQLMRDWIVCNRVNEK